MMNILPPARLILTGQESTKPSAVPSDSSKQRRIEHSPADLRVVSTVDEGFDDLRHYPSGFASSELTLVANGDHAESIWTGEKDLGSVLTRVQGIAPEPDPPIWTPRIGVFGSGLDSSDPIIGAFGACSVVGDASTVCHSISTLRNVPAGVAISVRTYQGEIQQPLVDGVPRLVHIEDDWPEAIRRIRDNVRSELFVSAFGAAVCNGQFTKAQVISNS